MEDFEEQEIDLRKYFSIVYKRRWTILAVFGVFLFFGVLITLRADPVYQSKARILIEKGSTDVSIEDIIAGAASPFSRDYFPTQYKIISSRAVAKKVIKNLNLENSTEFFPPEKDDFISNMIGGVKDFAGSIKKSLAGLLKKSKEGPTGESSIEPDIDPGLVSAFVQRVDVRQVEDSKLVDVAVEAKNPAMAAKMANALVDAYIEHSLETKLESAKDAVKWLSERIDEERAKVEEAENRLLRYKEEHGILTEFSDDVESINAEKLARLEQQVVEAESRRVEAQTRYRQATTLEETPDQLDSIPEVLSNEIVQEIKKMEVDLYNRRSELSKKYGSNHPQMVAIRSELDELRKRKIQEVKQIVNSLKNEYKLAVAREESLKAALAEEKAKTLAMNQKAIQYSVLKRQAESSRQLYDMLIKRFKETSLTEEMKGGNVRVIDRAEVPRTPIKPNKKRNVLLAAVVGLMLGVGLAFFLEYLDNTLKLPEEISEYLGIPFLGAVPAFEKEAQKKGTEKPELIALNAPKSTASESFRGVRTAILFSSPEKAPSAILVSSSGPMEGKTLCAANLAITMAQSGSRVIILDCDMRRPRMHRLFGVARQTGLSNYLVGSAGIKDAIFPTAVENLHLAPVGPIPPNPSEILGSQRMDAFIHALKTKYDRVIIDSPPVSAVTDAAILSQKVDGILLVVRAGETPRQMVQAGLAKLRAVNAHVLGGVLNGVRIDRDGYYYQYYYYSYYGEDEEEGGKKGKRKKSGKKKQKAA